MILEWTHPEGFPGIFETVYGGLKLRIEPVGSWEWDGSVDGFVVCGSDDLENVERGLLRWIHERICLDADELPHTPVIAGQLR